ncbi:MAG TPA: helix-turn-helix domain-containing protein [Candidatus Butyricicoccus avistercoris]|uniref:Helix-turn-helix domain-containing protein n=1 Tax=Candidatus Butyricicoccus avistercoris TaxID=2838518 RepID=A0A9D1PIL1_9FIRM|nr:helix-turn-helix domain-containing protein [Candidatus Butyricicoccus avistercoris]
MTILGERIRTLRRRSEMTQGELAKRLEISQSAVGMYEQGRREPPYNLLIKISKLFDVKLDWLLSDGTEQESRELDEMFEDFFKAMRQKRGLKFHGELLSVDEIESIIKGIKLGAELAIKQNI